MSRNFTLSLRSSLGPILRVTFPLLFFLLVGGVFKCASTPHTCFQKYFSGGCSGSSSRPCLFHSKAVSPSLLLHKHLSIPPSYSYNPHLLFYSYKQKAKGGLFFFPLFLSTWWFMEPASAVFTREVVDMHWYHSLRYISTKQERNIS